MSTALLNAAFEERRPALAALCRVYGVASLSLFGSAARGDWRADTSDLDFIVTFHPDPSRGIADRYLRLAEELEELFGRPVDLVTESAIRNPYFRRSVEAERTLVYSE